MRILATTPVNFNQKINNGNCKPAFGMIKKTAYLNECEEKEALAFVLNIIKYFKPSEAAIPGAKQFISAEGDTLLWYDKTTKPLEQLILSCKKDLKLEITFSRDMSDIADKIKKGLGIETKA